MTKGRGPLARRTAGGPPARARAARDPAAEPAALRIFAALLLMLTGCRSELSHPDLSDTPAVVRPDEPPSDLLASFEDSAGASRSGFRIPRGQVFEWKLPPGAEGNLRFSWAMLNSGAEAALEVQLVPAASQPRLLSLRRAPADEEIAVGLGISAVRFHSSVGPVILSDVRLVRPAKQNDALVFILIDTLRRDTVGLYGSSRPTTPRLDNFFATAWRAERAYAPASWTTPSVAALFTGQPPHMLGDDPGKPIGGQPTLASAFLRGGWSTAAFIANPTLNTENGFDAGFTTFYTTPYDPASMRIPAVATLEKIGQWLGAHGGEPFFLYIHLIDPHEPFGPPNRTRGVTPFDPAYSGSFTGEESFAELTFEKKPSPADVAHLRALYDEEVRYVDSVLGEFLDRLPEELRRRATFILTADHGEEFLEHGGWKHGPSLYDEVLRIPLLIRHPQRVTFPVRSDTLVSLLDIFPTMLELFHLPGRDRPLSGVSLLHPPARRSLPPIGMTTGGGARVALVDPDRKLMFFDRWGRRGIPDPKSDPMGNRLALHLRAILPQSVAFDLRADPGERRPLQPSVEEVFGAWRAIESAAAPARRGTELRIIGGPQPSSLWLGVSADRLDNAEPFAFEKDDRAELRKGSVALRIDVSAGDIDGLLIDAETDSISLRLQQSDTCVRMVAGGRRLVPGVPSEFSAGQIGNTVPRFEPHPECIGIVLWRAEGGGDERRATDEDETRKKLRALGYIH